MRSEWVKTIVLVVLGFLTSFALSHFEKEPEDNIKVTKATPIYQQPIGDDVNPDILIIYEAEVDGETVYPSVIKEGE